MVADSEADQPGYSFHLFMVRMWPEGLGGGRTDWRGKVQHVNSGEARYFRDLATLEAFVEGLLRRSDLEGPDAGRAGHGDMGKGGRLTPEATVAWASEIGDEDEG
jgi:hypothetical protein